MCIRDSPPPPPPPTLSVRVCGYGHCREGAALRGEGEFEGMTAYRQSKLAQVLALRLAPALHLTLKPHTPLTPHAHNPLPRSPQPLSSAEVAQCAGVASGGERGEVGERE
eukprot:2063527-Rhodomonas_salina.1